MILGFLGVSCDDFCSALTVCVGVSLFGNTVLQGNNVWDVAESQVSYRESETELVLALIPAWVG